jgi:Kef-type K+ transport system membrane component KefB
VLEAAALALVQLALMLVVATACGALFVRIGQSALIGEIVGGVLLGPSLLSVVAPPLHLFAMSGPSVALRDHVVKLAASFFLFAVGLELDPSSIRRHGLAAAKLGVLGALGPTLLGGLVVLLAPALWGAKAVADPLVVALTVGAAMSVTANPVLARLLHDLDLLKTPLGALLMTATLVDDLLAWSLMGLVLAGGASRGGPQAAAYAVLMLAVFAAFPLATKFALKPLVVWLSKRSSRLAVVLIGGLVVGSSYVTGQLGAHAFVGPFLLGVGLSSGDQVTPMSAPLRPLGTLTRRIWGPLFFVSMGLTVNLASHFSLQLSVVVFLVACATKVASVQLAGRLLGYGPKASLLMATGMNARGAVGILLAKVAFDGSLLDPSLYVALVLTALLTSIIAGPIMRRLARPEVLREFTNRRSGC